MFFDSVFEDSITKFDGSGSNLNVLPLNLHGLVVALLNKGPTRNSQDSTVSAASALQRCNVVVKVVFVVEVTLA